jgi:hypothetical protein
LPRSPAQPPQPLLSAAAPLRAQVFTRSSLFAAGTLIQHLKALGLADNVIVAAALRFPGLLALDLQGAVQALGYLYSLGLSEGWVDAPRGGGGKGDQQQGRQLSCRRLAAGRQDRDRHQPGRYAARASPELDLASAAPAHPAGLPFLPCRRRCVKDLVARSPRVLASSVEADLRPRVELFTSGLGFGTAQLAQLAEANPGILAADLATDTRPKLSFLQGSVGLSTGQVRQLLASDPCLLSNALPNLQRKWSYLQQEAGGGRDEVLACGCGYFSQSLMLSIGPRSSLVRRHGLGAAFCSAQQGDSVGGGSASGRASMQQTKASLMEALQLREQSSMWFDARHDLHSHLLLQAPGGAGGSWTGGGQRPDLQLLLGCSDAEFAAKVGLSPEEWQEWVREWVQTEGLQWSGVKMALS